MRRNVFSFVTLLAFLTPAKVAVGMTVEEYLARIESAIEKVENILESKDEAAQRGMDELDGLSEGLLSPDVSLPDGREISVDNGWVAREVSRIEGLESVERKEALRKLKGRLEALADQTKACVAYAPKGGNRRKATGERRGANDVDSKKVLNEILSQEEFAAPPVSQELVSFADKISNKINNLIDRIVNWFYKLKRWAPPEWLKDFFRWLGRLLGAPLRWLGGVTGIPFTNSVWAWIFWCGMLGLLFMLGFVLVRNRLGNLSVQRIKRASDEDIEETIIERPPSDILSTAQDLARKGDFRQAIRFLYLATLVHLHRNRLIVYDKTKTNWEYLSAIKESSGLYDKLAPLTDLFDLKWYGHEECRPRDFDFCRGLVSEIIETGGA